MATKKKKTSTKKKEKTDEQAPSRYATIPRREYDKLKQRAIRFEENNDRYILVIPVDGNKGWCEMGERSALFYKHVVCNKLGFDVSIKDDYDSYYVQYKIGRARIRGFDPVRDRLKLADMYKDEILRDKCMMFAMNRVFSAKEIEELEEAERKEQMAVNQIAKVQIMDPVLMTKLVEVSGRLHSACIKKMDKVSSATNGVRIVELCDKGLIHYYRMCGTIDATAEEKLEMWKTMREYLHGILIELQVIVALKICKRQQVIAISETVIELEERVDRHIAKMMRKVEGEKKDDAAS